MHIRVRMVCIYNIFDYKVRFYYSQGKYYITSYGRLFCFTIFKEEKDIKPVHLILLFYASGPPECQKFWWGHAYLVGLIYSPHTLAIRLGLTNLAKYGDSSCLDTFRRSCAYL